MVAEIARRGRLASKMKVRLLLGVTLHSEIADGDAELTLTLPYGDLMPSPRTDVLDRVPPRP